MHQTRWEIHQAEDYIGRAGREKLDSQRFWASEKYWGIIVQRGGLESP